MNQPIPLYDAIWKKAAAWARENHPTASMQHRSAFTNGVAYLVTGASGGSFGPSLREHLVSWKLAGENGTIGTVSLNGMKITALYPDGSLPQAGQWKFEDAVKFAEPLCFEAAENYLNMLSRIQQQEKCLDDDPADLEALRGKSVEG